MRQLSEEPKVINIAKFREKHGQDATDRLLGVYESVVGRPIIKIDLKDIVNARRYFLDGDTDKQAVGSFHRVTRKWLFESTGNSSARKNFLNYLTAMETKFKRKFGGDHAKPTVKKKRAKKARQSKAKP